MSQQQGFLPADSTPPSPPATVTTLDATNADLLPIPLGAVPATYRLTATVSAYESTGPSGAGYTVLGTFITDGVTARLVGNQDLFEEHDPLVDADAFFVASGNDAVLRVLGVAGLTIVWVGQSQIT